jgi:hypothetical protein
VVRGPRHTWIIAGSAACYAPRQCGLVSGIAWSQASSPRAWQVRAARPLPPDSKRMGRRLLRHLVRSRPVIWRPSSCCQAATESSTASPVIEDGRPSFSPGSPTRSQKVERPNAAHSVRVAMRSARLTSRTSGSVSTSQKRTGRSRSPLGWTIRSSAIQPRRSRRPTAWSIRISRSRPAGRSTSAPTAASRISIRM